MKEPATIGRGAAGQAEAAGTRADLPAFWSSGGGSPGSPVGQKEGEGYVGVSGALRALGSGLRMLS